MRLDPLSMTFVLLVTFVGTLIHIYAVAYMEHDADRRRFFAYLNLFIAAMLTLVLANSYLLLFFGWEGVGLASYLLIGFWNYRLDYAVAAKKAFVANRIGDLGLIIAMGLMFATFGSVSFDTRARAGSTPATSQAALNGIAIMLLLAACGKSAQFPLQSWLGDAMAGPTPVSALIHAATMVTAGVYLIVRSAPLFNAAPDAQLVVVCVGAVTLRVRGDRRLRQGRHQEGAGRLDDVADRLHGPGRRPRSGRATRSRSSTWSRTASSRPACSSAPGP